MWARSSTILASRRGRTTTAPGRCTGRSACRRAPERRSTCTTRTRKLTPWLRASATPSGSSAGHDGLPGAGDGTHGAGRLVQRNVMRLESLYQEITLDHYRHPHNKGLREPYDAEVHHVNPLCGDEVTLRVTIKDAGGEPAVADRSFAALGCSISQASASMMTEAVLGKTVRDAMDISGAFLELMQSRGK